jgi:hypothetical protein
MSQDKDGGVPVSSTDDVVRRLRGEEREATAAARVTGVEDEDVVERPRAGGAPRRGRELRAVATVGGGIEIRVWD